MRDLEKPKFITDMCMKRKRPTKKIYDIITVNQLLERYDKKYVEVSVMEGYSQRVLEQEVAGLTMKGQLVVLQLQCYHKPHLDLISFQKCKAVWKG